MKDDMNDKINEENDKVDKVNEVKSLWTFVQEDYNRLDPIKVTGRINALRKIDRITGIKYSNTKEFKAKLRLWVIRHE